MMTYSRFREVRPPIVLSLTKDGCTQPLMLRHAGLHPCVETGRWWQM